MKRIKGIETRQEYDGREPDAIRSEQQAGHSQSIEWYAPGQVWTVEVGGMQIAIRYVARKGRRSRIAITAPTGAVFRAVKDANSGSSAAPALKWVWKPQ